MTAEEITIRKKKVKKSIIEKKKKPIRKESRQQNLRLAKDNPINTLINPGKTVIPQH